MAIRILKGTVQMKNFEDYIISGILEAYILGLTDEQETLEVEQMAEASAEIRKEMDLISEIWSDIYKLTVLPLIQQ